MNIDITQPLVSAKKSRKGLFSSCKKAAQKLVQRLMKSKSTTSLKTFVLDHYMKLSGFGAITYGIYQASHIAGWIAGGLLVLLLEQQVGS